MPKPPKDRSESAIPRKLTAIQRQQDQDRASVLNTILPVLQDLQTQQDALEAQEAQLEAQQALLVRPDSDVASSTGWALTTTATTHGTASVTVPAGFSKAIVVVQAAGAAFLSGSAFDYFYLSGLVTVSSIGYSGPWSAPAIFCQGNSGTQPGATPYPSQQYATNYVYTGLSGGTINASFAVHTQSNNWSAQAANSGWVNLQTTFFN